MSTWATVFLGVIAVATLSAQSPSPAASQDGSMASLVSEVRLLRQAVETSTKSQVQVAALGVALSAEQSRMVQVSTELTAARAALSTAAATRVSLEHELTGIRQREASADLPPPMRQELSLQESATTSGLEAARTAESDAQAREVILTQSLQQEEARWTDLVGQLQQFYSR